MNIKEYLTLEVNDTGDDYDAIYEANEIYMEQALQDHLHDILSDDDTEDGGTATDSETLEDFIVQVVNDEYLANTYKRRFLTVDTVNQWLKECGIQPVKIEDPKEGAA